MRLHTKSPIQAPSLGRNVRPEIDIRVPDGRWSKEDVDAKILYTFGDCVLFSSRTERMLTLCQGYDTGAGEELPVASVVYLQGEVEDEMRAFPPQLGNKLLRFPETCIMVLIRG